MCVLCVSITHAYSPAFSQIPVFEFYILIFCLLSCIWLRSNVLQYRSIPTLNQFPILHDVFILSIICFIIYLHLCRCIMSFNFQFSYRLLFADSILNSQTRQTVKSTFKSTCQKKYFTYSLSILFFFFSSFLFVLAALLYKQITYMHSII